jgi:thiol-disulfide isomerase/thioredoxin
MTAEVAGSADFLAKALPAARGSEKSPGRAGRGSLHCREDVGLGWPGRSRLMIPARGVSMRMLIAGLALAGLLGLAASDARAVRDDKDKEEKKSDKLSIGDPAPALKATKWLQGKEVKTFDKDKVYVVEFWATWCGPCIAMMPHMAELQEHYKKDVTFIGFSSKDRSNTEDKVVAFVKKRGPKLKYNFAYADDRDTYDAYMTASGQGGIPCSFVVDKAGKIAWIGHPMYLDAVLPRVLKGKWDDDARKEVKKLDEEVNGVFKSLNSKDPEEALDKLAAFEKAHPEMKIPYFVGPKLNLMLRAKKTSDAKKMAESVIASAAKYDDTNILFTVSSVLRGQGKDDKDLMGLSVKAAEAMLKAAGEKDMLALYNMAETYFAKGDKEKAKEYGKKAVDAADNEGNKKFLENRLKAYSDDTKKEEKKEDNKKKEY